MAVDIFLKLTGIKGESKDAHGHKDEIHVESFSWGLTQQGTFGHGGGGGTGKVNVHDISMSKNLDKSSCMLMYHCCSGKHIGEGLITVRKSGDKPLEYLKIKLTDILVSSIQHSGSGHGDELTENLSINFAKFEVEYFEQNQKGGGSSAGTVKGDVPGNKFTG
jgi:type VI secretion system secreted protein Hcp